jgi:hypothetical protein
MSERIGYVIAVINQASAQAETVESEELYSTVEEATEQADGWREHARKVQRRDRYVVCEVIPVEG